MALAFQIQGANVSVGVQKKEIYQILDRKLLYTEFADRDPSLQGKIGTTIQFTAEFPPLGLIGGFTDVPNIPKRDPIQRARAITVLDYGDSREYTSRYIKQSQSFVEQALREDLTATAAREINAAAGAAMRLTNAYYIPTGAAGAETVTMDYGAVLAANAARPIGIWDLPQLIQVAMQNGIPPDPRYGWALVMHPAAAAPFMRTLQPVAQNVPEGFKQLMQRFEAGVYLGTLFGVHLFVDNSGDVLGLTATNAIGEAFFFGYRPLVEASVEDGLQTSTEKTDGGRKITFYVYREGCGWTLKVNDAGAGAVPPMRSSICCILITGG